MLESYIKFSARKMGRFIPKFLLDGGEELREIHFGKRYAEAKFGFRTRGDFR
jgi:hypothetical protein